MSFNDRIIAEFRTNAGTVSSHGFGSSLALVHSVGARSGEPRISPLMALPDGDAWLVIASKGGAPENPAWYYNLLAHPDTVVEVPGDGDVRTVEVRASEVPDAEWDAVWARFIARSPAFEKYTETAQGRRFPIVRLAPR